METGVLPVVIGGNFDAYWRSTGQGVAKAGMRAGLFHPTTGYSLPDAVRLASAIARAPDLSCEALARLTFEHAERAWRSRRFYRMLDTMLFRAAAPEQRYRVLERFYTLPEPLIGRFYAARSTGLDKLRILTGKPPVPIGRAIAAIVKGTK
jgi:lycopene beta-cyclase